MGYLCLKVKSLMPSALCSAHGSAVLACPGARPSSAESTSTVSVGNILPSTLNPCGWGTSPHSWAWRGAHSPALASERTASPGQRLVQVPASQGHAGIFVTITGK